MSEMLKIAGDLRNAVDAAHAKFARYSPKQWLETRKDDAWARIEILGHLIDSVVNNHQRIVRALAEGSLEWPNYAQEEHVRVQCFRDEDPAVVVNAWRALNGHLAHIIAHVPDASEANPISIGGKPAMTLAALARDYVRHLEHHVQQILAEKA